MMEVKGIFAQYVFSTGKTLNGQRVYSQIDYKPVDNKTGSYLLSHTATHAVPLAVRGLTTLFGMGRGDHPPYSHRCFHEYAIVLQRTRFFLAMMLSRSFNIFVVNNAT
jgi:hypothetical protein